MDKIIKIVEALEETGLWNNSVTETQKHEIKKQEGGFLGANSSYGFFFDTTYDTFIDKYYKKKYS